MAESNGFLRKAGLIVLGVVMTGLMGFVVWQAQFMVEDLRDVRGRVIRIEANVESLLDTRTAEKDEATARTRRRLDDLEQEADR